MAISHNTSCFNHGNSTDQCSSKKVIVGMSGGVDSSVSAWKLLDDGFEVEGLFMKNWEEDDDTDYCTAKEDLQDAERIADQLGIKLHKANFSAEYWDRVFEHFLSEYQQNRIPNPDVLCNKEIKFSAFLEYAKTLGADKIATGHYAQTQLSPSKQINLLKGIDLNKDQSYFLHALTPDQLAKSLFPIGHLTKAYIRQQAERLGFANHAKKDSTGVCFIGERRFTDFLSRYLPQHPGPIITDKGVSVGEHRGLLYYTIGQRQGLGIGGQKAHKEAAWFVAEKRAQDNTLIVVQDPNNPKLMSKGLLANQAHWINPLSLGREYNFHCMAKLRHRHADQACIVKQLDGDQLRVDFETPQRAINPGQYVVFYQGKQCLGGATIEQPIPL